MHFFVKISIASPYFQIYFIPNYSNIKDLPPFTPLNAFPQNFEMIIRLKFLLQTLWLYPRLLR